MANNTVRKHFWDAGLKDVVRDSAGVLPWDYPGRGRPFFLKRKVSPHQDDNHSSSTRLNITTPPGDYIAVGAVEGNVSV